MHETRAEMVRELRERRGKRDVEAMRKLRLRVARCGFGYRGSVDDRVGKRIEHRALHGGLVGEIERENARRPRDRSIEATDDADHFVSASRGDARDVRADEARGAGEK